MRSFHPLLLCLCPALAGAEAPGLTVAVPAAKAQLPNGNNVVAGTAPAGATVTVTVDGAAAGTGIANAAGQYNITVLMPHGPHTLVVSAAPGGQAPPRAVQVAPNPPVLTCPAADAKVLVGAALPGAQVTVFDRGLPLNRRPVTADGSGRFQVPLALNASNHSLTALQSLRGQKSPISRACDLAPRPAPSAR